MSVPEPTTAAIAWNPGTDDRILIAGDETNLPVIRTILATLPEKTRGQVFVEVGTATEVDPLVAPGRVMVCWIVRERGQSLARSLDAWLSEMLPVDGNQEHSVYAWVAADGAARLLTSD